MNNTINLTKAIYTGLKFVATILVCTLSCVESSMAQVDVSDRIGSGLIDSRIESYLAVPPKQEQQLDMFSVAAQQPPGGHLAILAAAPGTSFWITRDLGAVYAFTAKHAKADSSDTDTHNGTVSLFADSQIGFSIKPSLKYSSGDISAPSGSSATSHAITPALDTGLELLHLIFGYRYDPVAHPTSLLIGGSFGYSDADKDSLSAARVLTSTHSSTWIYAGQLSFGTPILTDEDHKPKLLGTLTPIYQYLDTRSKALSTGAVTPTYSGTFVLNCQFDYVLTPALKLTPFAFWYHDVNQQVPPGQQAIYQDWGEFGGKFAVTFLHSFKFRAGYSYEAYNSQYSSHKFSASLDYYF